LDDLTDFPAHQGGNLFDIIVFSVKLVVLVTISVIYLRRRLQKSSDPSQFSVAIPLLSGMLLEDLPEVIDIESLSLIIAIHVGAAVLIGLGAVWLFRYLFSEPNWPFRSPRSHSEL
jgi:hypothetical protein